ncbi:hypothetical protein QBC43DRAFT_373433 [Cladorrhinum sp. PSN259]|nr:hypothetical protein QBC43DRAFT_373433 [Cladorrhinum sp. PSN259]
MAPEGLTLRAKSDEIPALLADPSAQDDSASKKKSPKQARLQRLFAVRWRYYITWSLFLVWVQFLLAIFLYEILLSAYGTPTQSRSRSCKPGGGFIPWESDYNYWSGSDFFQITLGSGKLSFTEAKVIDIVWDVVVGRGGQAVIGYISWVVLSKFVAVSIQQSPISYTTFWGVFLRQESTLMGVYRLLADRTFYRALRSKIAIVFAVTSLVFVVAFPTLADAMTGYAPTTDAFIPQKSGDQLLVPYRLFEKVAYIIHDGWRVNGTANDIIPLNHIDAYSNNYEPYLDKDSFAKLRKREEDWESRYNLTDCHEPSIGACRNARTVVSRYVRTYGFYGLNTTTGNSTLFGGVPVPRPPLNISAFYLESEYDGGSWVDPRTLKTPFRDPSNVMLVYGNDTYTAEDIIRDGRCQPFSDDGYQWGFSFLQLFIVTLLLIIWTIGTWALWFKAYLNEHRISEYGRVPPKTWKGLLHLASAMREELAAAGIDAAALTDRQLAVQVRDRLDGGRVILPGAGGHTAIGIARYLLESTRKNIWAVLLILVILLGHVAALVMYLHQMVGWVVDGSSGNLPWQFVPMMVVWWFSFLALFILCLARVRRRWLCLYFVLSLGANVGAGMVPALHLYE